MSAPKIRFIGGVEYLATEIVSPELGRSFPVTRHSVRVIGFGSSWRVECRGGITIEHHDSYTTVAAVWAIPGTFRTRRAAADAGLAVTDEQFEAGAAKQPAPAPSEDE